MNVVLGCAQWMSWNEGTHYGVVRMFCHMRCVASGVMGTYQTIMQNRSVECVLAGYQGAVSGL